MNRLKSIFVLLLFLPTFIFCQDTLEYTIAKTKSGDLKIPGNWEQLNSSDDTGQIYFENNEAVIIAVAQNEKNRYPFYKKNASDFENVEEFYKWDSDYRKENNFETKKIKENLKEEYIIWKYNDGKLDNIFLYGSKKDQFLNLLVYTNKWSEEKQVIFLENLFKINR